jgi:Phage tail assembly chaperone proteins, E, or 41 or 14
MADEVRTTYKLKTPVKLGPDTIVSELQFRRPKGKDLRKLPPEESLNTVLILARLLSGQPDVLFDEMDVIDVQGVAEHIAGFMPSGSATGQKP